MAKKMRKLLAVALALTLCVSTFAATAKAAPWDNGWGNGWDNGWGNGWGNQYSDQYEWYQVYVQGNLVASGQGSGGDMYYLGTHYTAGISVSGSIVYWYINTHGGNGNAFNGTADLRDYITIPDGFTVKDYKIAESSVDGVNSAAGSAYFDNAIISITIETIYNDETGEEIEVPTEPDATEPTPAQTSVTVNHLYYTYDVYTGDTVKDGETSASEAAIEGLTYTASAVTSYKGNEYEQVSVTPAMSITIAEEAAANVINISYMRTIDTTPAPAQTSVTVNHLYYTYDIYTGETVQDGETSASEAAIENQSYTATAVTAYNGNAYEQLSVSPAMSITIAADAEKNVIDISYMRTIDTTPVEPDPTEPDPTEPPATEPPATEPPATEPPATEPPATEPPATEPPATEPPATEPPATEPPATEPPGTEPPATEPPATEPPATEPPATEPPATEPPATEPPATEPPATEPPATEPPATEPPATEPPVTERPVPPAPAVINEEIDIFDEDVPLADAPKTGDISALWIAVSGICAAGMVVLGKKREDEEE